MSVLSITLNTFKAMSKAPGPKPKWEKPNPRQFKINVDGSYHADSGAGYVGCVVWDVLLETQRADFWRLPPFTSQT
jgi:hypothetical protein